MTNSLSLALLAVSRMVGFRNVMCEMGLEQETATTIYQDNEAAIQIAMNRGALSKQSRHIDRRILASRNKIEDEQWFQSTVLPRECWLTLEPRLSLMHSSPTYVT